MPFYLPAVQQAPIKACVCGAKGGKEGQQEKATNNRLERKGKLKKRKKKKK